MDEDKCVRCGYCSRVCPTEAIKYGEILMIQHHQEQLKYGITV
ncbi:MAG: 4Fe-4S binding protein [Methanobacteriaceae archaeon]|nr:4Fe-4S binding protein [Methanobacteriaceae archaeon]MDI6882654.1 4Fe-4S binding protein [Methanothermobacter sp.]